MLKPRVGGLVSPTLPSPGRGRGEEILVYFQIMLIKKLTTLIFTLIFISEARGNKMKNQNEKRTRENNGKTEYFRGTFFGLSVWSPAPWENVSPTLESTIVVEHERKTR